MKIVVGTDFLLGDMKLVVSWNDTANGVLKVPIGFVAW
jgi:hypothetical protein